MDTKRYAQLSAMMFLQFFVWGAWFVTLGTYLAGLGFSGAEIGTAYLTNNIGAIISPFFIGLVADRYFNAEKVMAALHLLGGAVLFYVSDLATTSAIIIGLLVYNACYMPTLALVNSVAFNQMAEPDAEFPRVRVWGTLGWIVAGLAITYGLTSTGSNVEATDLPMKMAAAASILLGLMSLTLPATPPGKAGQKASLGEILGLDALALLKDRSFAIFAASSLLISIPLAFYYAFTNLYLNELGIEGVAAKMSLGQVSEVGFMVLMPFFFRRLGVKWMLFAGMLAWVVRYGFFATAATDATVGLLLAGILLHGVCYDFFFVTGQIYVDRKADKKIRASAQGFITLITYGVGLAIGSSIAGQVVDHFTVDGAREWAAIWWVPAGFAAIVLALFTLLFREEKDTAGA
ncbi:nucleoside permease [Gimibacter soli]|uniref:Nucleoside permease n=1 Tax=Gimibacter soli TaxID=3024400 RepID=A0AAE9XTY2_9PROT|nr:nucleoside permease [Gimibacter soli]WCL55225.1 nucleoside permease [Gimibacter soli]